MKILKIRKVNGNSFLDIFREIVVDLDGYLWARLYDGENRFCMPREWYDLDDYEYKKKKAVFDRKKRKYYKRYIVETDQPVIKDIIHIYDKKTLLEVSFYFADTWDSIYGFKDITKIERYIKKDALARIPHDVFDVYLRNMEGGYWIVYINDIEVYEKMTFLMSRNIELAEMREITYAEARGIEKEVDWPTEMK